MIANGYFLRLVAERYDIRGIDLSVLNGCADRLEAFEAREVQLRDLLGDEDNFVQAARKGTYAERSDELRAEREAWAAKRPR